MAKKKIGDIASAHDLNPKEVVKQLQDAGFSVQSATSTIEERLALKVLESARNGAEKAEEAKPAAPRRVQPAGSQPRPQERRPRGGDGDGGGRPQAGGRPQQGGGRSPQGQRPQRPDAGRTPGAGPGAGQRGGGGGGAGRGGRPTRDDQRTGERAPNAGG